MSGAGLWTWALILGCYVGYASMQQSAYYYDYYQPSYYQPQQYQPNYYSSYNYQYPAAYQYPEYRKPGLKPGLPHDVAQKLLQLFRLIRLVALCRSPPPHYKLTSLDILIIELTDDDLQKKLVEQLHNVDGYQQVAQLSPPADPDTQALVNDNARLLMAIQYAFNALDLENLEYYGYVGLPNDLRYKLRQLRDEANSLTVEDLYHEAVYPLARQAEDIDDLETRIARMDPNELLQIIDSFDHPEDAPAELEHVAKDLPFDDDELFDMAATLVQAVMKKPEDQATAPIVPEATTASIVAITETEKPITPSPFDKKEGPSGYWFGSFLRENNLPLGSPSNDSQDEQPTEVFDIDPRLKLTSTTEKPASAVTHSVPLWLLNNAEAQDQKDSRIELLTKLEKDILKESRQNTINIDIEVENEVGRELPDYDEKFPTRFDLLGDLMNDRKVKPIIAFENYSISESSTPSATESNARWFIKRQLTKFLSLLVEANGFTSLKDNISEQEVDWLANELGAVQGGVMWTEMISALQKLISRKQMTDRDQILEVLENWKEGEQGQLDNGYFERIYGGAVGEEKENRELKDDELKWTDGETNNGGNKNTTFVDTEDHFFDGYNNRTLNKAQLMDVIIEQVKNKTMNSNLTLDSSPDNRNPRN